MKTVLVIDDETDLRDITSLMFQLKGFSVVSASDGYQALDMVEKHAPDIIISDFMMPVMDGLEFCKRLRANPSTNRIPIILMSAMLGACDRANAGFDGYIPKPFRFNDLMAKVEKLLY